MILKEMKYARNLLKVLKNLKQFLDALKVYL